MQALTTALGVNLSALCYNAAGFLVFTWLLARFVFPSLTRALDAKRDELVATSRLKLEAESRLASATGSGDKLIAAARAKADAAIAAAQVEAAELIRASRDKADSEAKRIIAEAQADLAHEVAQARVELKMEMARLVATETEALLGQKLSSQLDAQLIKNQLEVIQ